MKRETRRRLPFVVCFVVILAVVAASAYVVSTVPVVSPRMPLLVGSVIHVTGLTAPILTFSVIGPGATIVGAYNSDTGVWLTYEPAGQSPLLNSCPLPSPGLNATLSWHISAGTYDLWPVCGPTPANLTVTQKIQMLYG